jgi:hypothetical protein
MRSRKTKALEPDLTGLKAAAAFMNCLIKGDGSIFGVASRRKLTCQSASDIVFPERTQAYFLICFHYSLPLSRASSFGISFLRRKNSELLS